MGRRRRVAVCADDSPGSMRACRYAAQHVLDRDTDVDLVTAVRETPTTDPGEEGERVLDFHRAQLELCQMPAARVRKVIVRCRPRESAASAVLRAVKDADAVVCGSRGLGGAQKALLGVAGLGSVSDELVRGSRVPVTVVPSTTPVPEMIAAREGADASAETKKRQR